MERDGETHFEGMFYLTMYSTHLIYGYIGERERETERETDREENVLFNDALDTFLLRLYWREREGKVLFNEALDTFWLWLYWRE